MAEHDSTTTALVIAGITILQDPEGRYSLNTLHRASGGKRGKEPSQWLENKSTQELIAECEGQNTFSCIDVVKGGNTAGTYAHELLAVSYAGWISPAFQLKVNQGFLSYKKGLLVPVLDDPVERYPQLRAIRELITATAVAQLTAERAEERAQAAEVRAVRAEEKADLALEDARYLAVEEFVIKNGLVRQLPQASWRTMSEWLKRFCQEYGLDIRKAPVYGKPWDDENAYPWQAFSAYLRYDQKRPRQITLVKEPGA
jgi:hypothetical protein